MKASKRPSNWWWGLIAATLISLLVYSTLWWSPWYWEILAACGIASAVCTVRLVLLPNRTRWTVPAACIAIVVGQWWLLEFLAAQVLWRLHGFAP